MEQSAIPQKTLYIECTHTAKSGLNTGIQRVVREIISHLPEVINKNEILIKTIVFEYDRFVVQDFRPVAQVKSKAAEFNFWYILRKLFLYSRRGVAFFLPEGRAKFFIKGPRYDKRTLAYLVGVKIVDPILKFIFSVKQKLNIDDYRKSIHPKIEFKEGDVLLLLDSSWYIKFWDEIARFKKQGGKIYNVVYDLIPITHSQFCDDFLVHVFKNYFYTSARYVDKYICISKAVSKQLELFLKSNSSIENLRKISFFHLGSDFNIKNYNDELVDPEIKKVFNKKNPIYLIVSTVEPRKNHEYLLKVFDELWSEGSNVGLCIVGRIGWKVDKLIIEILKHPKLGKQLYMFNDACDADVSYCYEHSSALLFPSIIEGFGLPIIEGLQRGLPVFASSTEIHKEVGGEHVKYFDISSSSSLKQIIKEHINSPELFKINTDKVKTTSWNRSAAWLWEEIEK